MELSLFLAKLFGIYMLIVATLWVVRGDVLAGVIEEILADRPMLFLSGLIALLVGISIAIGHCVWEPNWRGLITLFGYLSIAKGITRIGFPDVPKKGVHWMLKSNCRWIFIGVIFAVGAYLTWAGFTQ